MSVKFSTVLEAVTQAIRDRLDTRRQRSEEQSAVNLLAPGAIALRLFRAIAYPIQF
ncbi:hypothetical protein [Microcoleus sp. PH2017_30_WIL_O_A]|uniref:hypothetical protein n=1 Tax=Microcoleus sp. PH2017_30_WIL_O_A TaxID=2798840 RepID=UPI001D36DE97|nr:hypothetical protein [Microcoleus sp. PH2017_30_WIL_O_A]MCC3582675.1 hypothetical protein [Microcoleus sp. PH2017_30_WIL_O_A]